MTSHARLAAGVLWTLAALPLVGCRSPLRLDPVRYAPDQHGATVGEPHAGRDRYAPTPELGTDATLADYLAYAALRSPALRAAYYRARALAERSPQVGALPDPRLTYGFFIREVETRVGPQRHQLGVAQTLPWPGLLDARADAADHEARAAYLEYQAGKLELFERVRTAYARLNALEQLIEIARAELRLLTKIEQIAQRRYAVGAGEHRDLIRAQLELAREEDHLRQLVDRLPAARAALNAAIGRSADAPIEATRLIEPEPVRADVAALTSAALDASPVLRAFDERGEAQRRRTDAARAEGMPDVTVGLAYTVIDDARFGDPPDSGQDAVLATFGVRIPVWRARYEAAVGESIARRLALAAARSDEAIRLEAEIHRLAYEHADALDRIHLHETTLIPKGEASLTSTLAAFEVGRGGFIDVVDATRSLLAFREALVDARARAAIARAKLERLVGRPLDTLGRPSSGEED